MSMAELQVVLAQNILLTEASVSGGGTEPKKSQHVVLNPQQSYKTKSKQTSRAERIMKE